MKSKIKKILLSSSIIPLTVIASSGLSISCSSKKSIQVFNEYIQTIEKVNSTQKMYKTKEPKDENTKIALNLINQFYVQDFFDAKKALDSQNNNKILFYLNEHLNEGLEISKQIVEAYKPDFEASDDLKQINEKFKTLRDKLWSFQTNKDSITPDEKNKNKSSLNNLKIVLNEFVNYFSYDILQTRNIVAIETIYKKLDLIKEQLINLINWNINNIDNTNDSNIKKNRIQKAYDDALKRNDELKKNSNPFVYKNELLLSNVLNSYFVSLQQSTIKKDSNEYWDNQEKNFYRLWFINSLFDYNNKIIKKVEPSQIASIKDEFRSTIKKAETFYKPNCIGEYVYFNKVYDDFAKLVNYIWMLGPKDSKDSLFIVSVYEGWINNFNASLKSFEQWSKLIDNFEPITIHNNFLDNLDFPSFMHHYNIYTVSYNALYSNQNNRGS